MSNAVLRKPPSDVLTALRNEVSFHCPAPTAAGICGSPFLTWHHFDPPWHVEHHHRPEGMIALCREHADKADNGSYTDDQLRRFKAFAADSAASVRGEFSWMRNKLIARMGGNFYVDTTILVAVTGLPLVWFERNKHGELMLNYRLSGQRAVITNNSWEIAQEELQEVICKPGGRSLDVRHLDGSRLKVVFSEHVNRAAFRKSYPVLGEDAIPLADSDFPVTVVDVTSVRPVGTFQLHPGWTALSNGSKLRDHWFFGNRIALELGLPLVPAGLSSRQLQMLAEARVRANRGRASRA